MVNEQATTAQVAGLSVHPVSARAGSSSAANPDAPPRHLRITWLALYDAPVRPDLRAAGRNASPAAREATHDDEEDGRGWRNRDEDAGPRHRARDALEYLDLRVKARKATNVTLRLVASDDPQLDPGGVDTILMIDAIHYVKDRVTYAKKLRPALAPGGRVVIIDYRPKPMSERPWGPPPEQQFPKEQMDQEMGAAGFRVSKAFDFLPEQFFVIYVPR